MTRQGLLTTCSKSLSSGFNSLLRLTFSRNTGHHEVGIVIIGNDLSCFLHKAWLLSTGFFFLATSVVSLKFIEQRCSHKRVGPGTIARYTHGTLIEAQCGFPVRYANKTQKAKASTGTQSKASWAPSLIWLPHFSPISRWPRQAKAKTKRWHVNESVVHKSTQVDHDVGYYGKCDQVKYGYGIPWKLFSLTCFHAHQAMPP